MVSNCSHFHADDLRECGPSCRKIAIWAESAGDIAYLCPAQGKNPGNVRGSASPLSFEGPSVFSPASRWEGNR